MSGKAYEVAISSREGSADRMQLRQKDMFRRGLVRSFSAGPVSQSFDNIVNYRSKELCAVILLSLPLSSCLGVACINYTLCGPKYLNAAQSDSSYLKYCPVNPGRISCPSPSEYDFPLRCCQTCFKVVNSPIVGTLWPPFSNSFWTYPSRWSTGDFIVFRTRSFCGREKYRRPRRSTWRWSCGGRDTWYV